MVASAIHVLDSRGKVLISRDYRGDVPLTAIEEFSTRFQEQDEQDELPIFVSPYYYYILLSQNFDIP